MVVERPQASARVVLAGLLAATLSGCISVDGFANRAVTYNEHMQASREDAVLRNVLRAAYDEPLQFTEVSTVTGTASAQGSIGSDLPLLGPARGDARLYTFSPGGEINGGQSFAVANLNSKEFFNGLASPVKPETIAGLENAGYSRIALLLLVVERITLERNGQPIVLRNDPGDPIAYGSFVSALNGLLSSGLVFGVETETKYVGPPLTAADVATGAVLAELVKRTDGPELAEIDLIKTPLSGADAARFAGQNNAYRLATKEKSVRFCFSTGYDRYSRPNAWTWSGSSQPSITLFVDSTLAPADRQFRVRPSVKLACTETDAVDRAGDPLLLTKISLTTRSVRDAYGYLGKIVRIRMTQPGTSAYLDTPIGNGPDQVLRLFALESAIPPEKGVKFRGQQYRVTHAGLADRSASVIAMLAELTAAYSSSKDLPTPSVIAIQQQ